MVERRLNAAFAGELLRGVLELAPPDVARDRAVLAFELLRTIQVKLDPVANTIFIELAVANPTRQM